MTPGDHLRAWRNQRRLSLVAVAELTGIPGSTWSHAERGMPAEAGTVARILAATGVDIPVFVPKPQERRTAKTPIEEDESDLRGKRCWHCCGLPHRRPQSKPCRCGESWAPDIVQHPVPGLRSSASWCGDYADAKEDA